MPDQPSFPYLRALTAAGGAAFTDDDFAVLDAPAEASREDLERVIPLLRQVALTLREAQRNEDVVATLQETADVVGTVRTELDGRPDPEAIAASLLTAIGGDGPGAPGPTRWPAGVQAPHDPRRTRRVASGASARATLVAAGGGEVGSVESLAESLVAAGVGLRDGRLGGSRLVASLRVEYPEERRLSRDMGRNARILEAVTGPAALTASGGICGPLAVDYSVPVFSTADRPLRDSLPRFGADRGGVTFRPSPSVTSLAGATSVWTEAVDADPQGATKAIATIECSDPQSVAVDAIPTRIKLGNFLVKFDPEWQQASVQSALAAAARVAELNLLGKINAASTETTSTAYLGATRDLLATIDLVCAAMRERQRVPRTTAMRVVLFDWMRDMVRSDLARELAHDRDGENNLAVTDAQIDAYLAVRGIQPIWVLDPLAAQATGRTYPLQGFAAQAAGALNGWPAKAVFYCFPEGSFVYLDGGELNLGMITDSTLAETNDAQMFVEPFESIAFRGVESIKVIAPLAPSGGSAGSIATSTYTAGT